MLFILKLLCWLFPPSPLSVAHHLFEIICMQAEVPIAKNANLRELSWSYYFACNKYNTKTKTSQCNSGYEQNTSHPLCHQTMPPNYYVTKLWVILQKVTMPPNSGDPTKICTTNRAANRETWNKKFVRSIEKTIFLS